MKRFVVSVLSISVFFVGLGALAEHVEAKFKSDEKALEIIRKARAAIGGEAALAEVRSLVIGGRTVNTIKAGDAERSEPGETEIALQLPDKLSKTVKIGKNDGNAEEIISKQQDVIVFKKGEAGKVGVNVGDEGEFVTSDGQKIVIKGRVAEDGAVTDGNGHKIVVRKMGEGEAGTWTTKDGEKHVVMARSGHAGMKQNELLRLTLALLLTAPEGADVNYTFGGESSIDGTAVNIVNAEFGGANYRLFIGKSNDLPVAMSYVGLPMPMITRVTKGAPEANGDHAVFMTMKKTDADPAPVEHLVKFSDYRSTGSVQLPYKWTTSVGGTVRETFDVTSYDINPANIADRFKDRKVFVRTKKADGQ